MGFIYFWLIGSISIISEPSVACVAPAASTIVESHSQPGLCNKEECVAVIGDNSILLVIVPYDIQACIQRGKAPAQELTTHIADQWDYG